MVNLLVKQDGIYLIQEMPVKTWKPGEADHWQLKKYEAALQSAKDSAIWVQDQDQAWRLALRLHAAKDFRLRLDAKSVSYKIDNDWYEQTTKEGTIYPISGWRCEIGQVLSPGWVPTYNDPDNSSGAPNAEPMNVALLIEDTNLPDKDCIAFCNNQSPACADCPKVLSLADVAFEEAKGGNINFWSIQPDDPEVKYWKEVWIKGYTACQSELTRLREENAELKDLLFKSDFDEK